MSHTTGPVTLQTQCENLEVRFAFQERLTQELSMQMYQMQKEMQQMREEIKRLRSLQDATESNGSQHEKPPHY
jgi:uncharacterized coiled-coil protein SlyX